MTEQQTFRPLGDRVALERLEPETEIGGILLPQTAVEKMNRGRVVAIGNDVTEVQAGDLVLFGKYAGSDLSIDGRPVSVMREEEILAVLAEAEA
jgi:chaperonin GroES